MNILCSSKRDTETARLVCFLWKMKQVLETLLLPRFRRNVTFGFSTEKVATSSVGIRFMILLSVQGFCRGSGTDPVYRERIPTASDTSHDHGKACPSRSRW